MSTVELSGESSAVIMLQRFDPDLIKTVLGICDAITVIVSNVRFGSQIPLATEGFELKISCMQSVWNL